HDVRHASRRRGRRGGGADPRRHPGYAAPSLRLSLPGPVAYVRRRGEGARRQAAGLKPTPGFLVPPPVPIPREATRLAYLDGLRGWMALVVVLTHLFASWLLLPPQL